MPRKRRGGKNRKPPAAQAAPREEKAEHETIEYRSEDDFDEAYEDDDNSSAASTTSRSDVSELDGEGSEGYRPGGYHPVRVGDVFHARYTVVEKLGWGHFSTVWACKDADDGSGPLVALKVQKSAAHYADAALDEIDLLRHARRVADDEAKSWDQTGDDPSIASSRIVRLLDHFEHQGPNGRHVCMVFELLGVNLLSVIRKSEYHGLPVDAVRAMTKQICLGLDFLHRKCAIIHTDLKPENVLLKRARAPRPVVLRERTNTVPVQEVKLEKDMTSDERKKLKKKLKKQRQKQRKKGANEEETGEPFEVLRLPDGTQARSSSLTGPLAANFEDDAIAAVPEPLTDELSRMVLRPCDHVDETSLRARVAFVAPWARVYGALGPDHRRKQMPEALDRAQWRCCLDSNGEEQAVFAVRGDGREPQADRVLARAAALALNCASKTASYEEGLADPTLLSAWTVRFDPSKALVVLGFLESKAPGLRFMSCGPNAGKDACSELRAFADARESFAGLVGVDLGSLQACAPSDDRVVRPKPLARRLQLAARRAAPPEEGGAPPTPDSLPPVPMQSPTLDTVDEPALLSALPPPPMDEPAEDDGVPDDLASLCDAEVAVVDLGNACWRHKHFTEDIQTRQYRSPEVIVGAPYDTSADVWSLACVVFELLTGDLLFDPRAGGDYDRDEDHLAQMQELLGRYPKKLATASRARRFFTRRGELKHIHQLRFWDIEKVLNQKYHVDPADAREIASFLRPLLEFAPGARCTLQEALAHPWLARPQGTSAPPVEDTPEEEDAETLSEDLSSSSGSGGYDDINVASDADDFDDGPSEDGAEAGEAAGPVEAGDV